MPAGNPQPFLPHHRVTRISQHPLGELIALDLALKFGLAFDFPKSEPSTSVYDFCQ